MVIKEQTTYNMQRIIDALSSFFKLRKPPEKDDYTCLPGASGIAWFLGRQVEDSAGFSDSRSYLEQLGFIILGKADEKRYSVEPPTGWKKLPLGNGYHQCVIDETNTCRMWIFEKHEPWEFKAHVFEHDEKMEEVFQAMMRRQAESSSYQRK
jgi:hypothetical protein